VKVRQSGHCIGCSDRRGVNSAAAAKCLAWLLGPSEADAGCPAWFGQCQTSGLRRLRGHQSCHRKSVAAKWQRGFTSWLHAQRARLCGSPKCSQFDHRAKEFSLAESYWSPPCGPVESRKEPLAVGPNSSTRLNELIYDPNRGGGKAVSIRLAIHLTKICPII
jgi:hypothetical protein